MIFRWNALQCYPPNNRQRMRTIPCNDTACFTIRHVQKEDRPKVSNRFAIRTTHILDNPVHDCRTDTCMAQRAMIEYLRSETWNIF